jgi:hypothetical protein
MQPETNLIKDYSVDRFKNSVAKGDKGKIIFIMTIISKSVQPARKDKRVATPRLARFLFRRLKPADGQVFAGKAKVINSG